MTMSAPRPVKTPPTEVASRQPWAVVSNSGIAARCGERRVGKIPRYQSLARICRQSRQFVGEVLRVTDAEDLRRGVMPETPGRKGDRGQQRLQMARRQVDD
jgi:hypothetical protein